MYQYYRHTKKPAFILVTLKDAKLPSEAKAEEWQPTRVTNDVPDAVKKSIEEKGYHLVTVRAASFEQLERKT